MPRIVPPKPNKIAIDRHPSPLPTDWQKELVDALNDRLGAFFQSSVETKGRYHPRQIGFVDPPLAVIGRGRLVEVVALNRRGLVLLKYVRDVLEGCPDLDGLGHDGTTSAYTIRDSEPDFAEEKRTRQRSVFSALRTVRSAFHDPADLTLGLYGAFGYDLVFQLEAIPQRLARARGQRDLLLYLPDQIMVDDPDRGAAALWRYEFSYCGETTVGIDREPVFSKSASISSMPMQENEFAAGEYAALVEKAKHAFRRGDLFEVVLSQSLRARYRGRASALFRRVASSNPAPYGALINLGEGEHLISASPEMFVRVTGETVTTSPISGTIARGKDALEDARQIRRLLMSAKDEAELTMCTDVDRNDKARVCEPGSVRVTARRQIEMHARLIHTVDQVEGRLRPGFDALDAFLSHAWAVTTTGAPKPGAIHFIEENETSARGWYAGAIGWIGFDGSLDTGLTLRTIRLKGDVAEVRAGATLLIDSDPEAENAECMLKASALLACIRGEDPRHGEAKPCAVPRTGGGHLILVDHQDSFVHTLADLARQCGATVETLRPDLARKVLREGRGNFVFLSPGPGKPSQFALDETIGLALERRLPVFGVCLGMQAIAEFFGGRLFRLDQPVHGKSSKVRWTGSRLLRGLPPAFHAGRYHSLAVSRGDLPRCLEPAAISDDGIIMALEHATLPIAGVQFHPESILTAQAGIGLRIVDAALSGLRGA